MSDASVRVDRRDLGAPRSWRSCLAALTDALARAEREDVVLLDVASFTVRTDSTLDDVDKRRARAPAVPVTRPDGLWEWQIRRDFVRSIRKTSRDDARRLAATLAGTRTKRRFEVVLGLVHDQSLIRAFALHRRRRLRAWAGRLLRAALAGYVAAEDVTPSKPLRPRKKPRRRRPSRKRRSKYVPYVS
ncbi:MAG: hypothetical protein JWP87_2309 [Labilithrix sp.]|nr:hypothetical protein [Labilithrix sp.]